MLIDTHAHLTWDCFQEDLKEVIQRTLDNGISTVINVGADQVSSKSAASLDCTPLKSYSTIGLHPHEANKLTATESIHQYIGELEKVYQESGKKVVAIGECGLDYFRLHEESRFLSEAKGSYFFGSNNEYLPPSLSLEKVKEQQKMLFLAHTELAKKLNLPLVIHCRDAWEDIFLPELEGTKGVFHSFNGSEAEAKKVFNLGYYFGINCTITYPKNEPLRQLLKTIPLKKILTETDCPFLPPQTQRGQRNEPSNIVEVVKVIAEVKGISFEKIVEITYQNALSLFPMS